MFYFLISVSLLAPKIEYVSGYTQKATYEITAVSIALFGSCVPSIT